MKTLSGVGWDCCGKLCCCSWTNLPGCNSSLIAGVLDSWITPCSCWGILGLAETASIFGESLVICGAMLGADLVWTKGTTGIVLSSFLRTALTDSFSPSCLTGADFVLCSIKDGLRVVVVVSSLGGFVLILILCLAGLVVVSTFLSLVAILVRLLTLFLFTLTLSVVVITLALGTSSSSSL